LEYKFTIKLYNFKPNILRLSSVHVERVLILYTCVKPSECVNRLN